METMNDTRQMHRRWVGSCLSLLLPGAGIFLAGDKGGGLKWFSRVTALWLVILIVTPLPGMPALAFLVVASGCVLALQGWMVVRSYRPIPKLRLQGWVKFFVVAIAVGEAESIFGRHLIRTFQMPTHSMETTLMPGDRVVAQTCAYWFGQPKRGDIVVFKTDGIDAPMLPKGQYYVKRIAGLPGEKLEIKDGRLLVNDHLISMPAVLAKDHFTPFSPGPCSISTTNTFAIPTDHYFLVGNNATNSYDGRNFGPIPRETAILAKAHFTPFSPGLSSISTTNTFVIPADRYFVVGDNATNSYDSRYFGPIPRQNIYGKITKIYWPLSRSGDIQ